MASYLLSNRAIEDLARIWNYTFNTWSETQADNYYNMLLQSCEELGNETVVGKKYPEIDDNILGYRIGQHLIFYRIAKASGIEVARILHSRMDLTKRFEE